MGPDAANGRRYEARRLFAAVRPAPVRKRAARNPFAPARVDAAVPAGFRRNFAIPGAGMVTGLQTRAVAKASVSPGFDRAAARKFWHPEGVDSRR
ncbi:MAG: hypothetical protein HUJ24_08890 [Rhodobacteraceae bacterium]|nr:hypothetical protein [Paracoccaceae bacterium]